MAEHDDIEVEGHECDRFWNRGLSCPFRRKDRERSRTKEEEDKDADDKFVTDDPDDKKPEFVAVGHPKVKDKVDARARSEGNIIRLAERSFDPVELPRAAIRLEEQQRQGGLKSIPDIRKQLQERGPGAIMALLTGLALAEGFRRSQGKNFSGEKSRVRTVERQAAGRLSGLSKTITGTTARGGRGGMAVNDTERMRSLFGFSGKRKLKEGGSGAFGFFFPGEPT